LARGLRRLGFSLRTSGKRPKEENVGGFSLFLGLYPRVMRVWWVYEFFDLSRS